MSSTTDAGSSALFAEMEKGPSGEVGFYAFRRWFLAALRSGRVT
eukprot:COSAG01_NODE_58666_length_304_cov_2.165854_1_plen_43_part_10